MLTYVRLKMPVSVELVCEAGRGSSGPRAQERRKLELQLEEASMQR